eukprot:SAG31_NODE_2692_length_5239_cov_52.795525_5_plen_60_part_00
MQTVHQRVLWFAHCAYATLSSSLIVRWHHQGGSWWACLSRRWLRVQCFVCIEEKKAYNP